MAIKNNIRFLKKNYQIIYSLILIIFIPLAIILNTVVFTYSFKKNIDQELYAKATTIGEIINANTLEILDNPTELQKRIEVVSEFNSEIKSLDILFQSDEDFEVVASLDKKSIGTISEDIKNVFAWRENHPVAFLTTSPSLAATNQKINFQQKNERFWLITMPLKNAEGGKTALLSLKVSLAAMDLLTKQVLIRSYIILAFTIIIIILLLANNTRLFEYATLYRKLQEVDQMKDEFISVASHELRTPVTGIRGYTSMILEGTFGPINDKMEESLKIIQASSERLALLVEDLLNVSRIEQGRFKLDSRPQNVNQIIKDVSAELKVQSDKKSLKLEYKPHTEKLPKINIDADRFNQVLINLIGNAIKYTLKGGVEIITEEKDNGKTLEIKIKDTGIGMSAKDRERLFEKFYRVQSEKTKKITGTGLGLWITKQIIEMMKGEIMVDSIESVGTQVTLRFPVFQSNK